MPGLKTTMTMDMGQWQTAVEQARRIAEFNGERIALGLSGAGKAGAPGVNLATQVAKGAGEAGAVAGTSFFMRFMKGFGGYGVGKMGMMELVHTFRATFDAIAAGINPWRIFLYEAPQAAQAFSLMLSDKVGAGLLGVLAKFAVGAAAVAAIIAAPFIYMARVNSLAADLASAPRADLSKPDLTRVSALEAAWNRVRMAIRAANDEIHSANAAFEFQTKLLDQSMSTERRLLEIRKQKDMDMAGDNPQKRAAIRDKYLKEEHDLQAKEIDARQAEARKHIDALTKERDEKIKAASDIRVATEKDDAQHVKDLQAQVDLNEKQEKGKEKGSSLFDKAQAQVEALQLKKRDAGKIAGQGTFGPVYNAPFSETDQLRLDQAEQNLEQMRKDKRTLQEYQRGKNERDKQRAEQARLYGDAEKLAGEAVKAQDAYDKQAVLARKQLTDSDKIRAAEAQERNQKDAMRQRFSLNADQRIGAYAAVPGQRSVEGLLEKIAKNTEHLKPEAHPVVGRQRAQYGGIHQ